MDIWTVAVAAGAGYIAQHFKQIISESSSNTVQPESPKQPPDKKWPFRRSLKREKLGEDDSKVKHELSEGVSSMEVTSTSEFDGEKGVIYGNYEDSCVFSSSSLFPGFISSDGLLGDSEGMNDFLYKPSTSESRPSYGSRGGLRSRRRNGRAMIRPLSSLESCLMAQLYNEHVQTEETLSTPFPSPSMQTARPFLVTDGSKVISKSSGDAFFVQNRSVEKKLQKHSGENGIVSGVPPLPNIGSLEIREKDHVDTRRGIKERLNNSSTMAIGKQFHLPRGSSDATLLLCLGMSFGIVYSFVENRREVEKLNGLLKQTQNLVQDLQEELEMKDSLIVQELIADDQKSQQTHNDSPHSISHEDNLEESTRYDLDQKAKDDSLSKIEAELEAELEMLELNMTSSTREGGFSNLVELDSNFATQGELRADMFGRQGYGNEDGSESSSTTPHSANYAVSPRELSLRLHELLQSQLEQRIKELEAEMENKKKQGGAQNRKSWEHHFSSSEAAAEVGDVNHIDEPVLNLSGEALDAYNEAYKEFAKIDESEDEDLCQVISLPRSLGQTDETLCSPEDHFDLEGTPILRTRKDNEANGDEQDEMEKLLIKHIVEKARKGSPVVLNAQKALFSMDFQ